jgi:hypothetical protein
MRDQLDRLYRNREGLNRLARNDLVNLADMAREALFDGRTNKYLLENVDAQWGIRALGPRLFDCRIGRAPKIGDQSLVRLCTTLDIYFATDYFRNVPGMVRDSLSVNANAAGLRPIDVLMQRISPVLTARELDIARSRFFGRPVTILQELSARHGVSSARISQIARRAWGKIHKIDDGQTLRDIIDYREANGSQTVRGKLDQP